MNGLLDAAVSLAKLGLAPVPLYGIRDGRCTCGKPDCDRSIGKHPIGDRWQETATADLDRVRARFLHHDGNIGAYLGGVHLLLDADGPEGLESLKQLGELPPTLAAESGSGGRHHVFRLAPNQDAAAITDRRIASGLDVKIRGQFVASPSLHVSGRQYRWIHYGPPVELPQWLYERVRKPPPRVRTAPRATTRGDATFERLRRYIAKMPAAISGQGGHAATFAVALKIVGNRLTAAEELELMCEYNERCQPLWSERELEHKLASARTHGQNVGLPDRERLPRYDAPPPNDDDYREGGGTSNGATGNGHSSVRPRDGQAGRSDTRSASSTWPEPRELPASLPPVPVFDDRLLPEALAPWIMDVAERTQCPAEYPAVGAVVAAGAVIGRSRAIRPKRRDDWIVTPNMWGAIVGPPSSMKSPALTEALRPLRRLAAEASELHHKAAAEWQFSSMVAEERIKGIKRRLASAKGDQLEDLRAQLETACAENEPPHERRYIVNDSTVEKLGELLNQNPRGLLHFRDELTGWLATLDREGHEGDRAFFLESWNGTGAYTYDRIGRGTLHIPSVCLALLGGIQPGPLGRYLRAAIKGGAGDDGLIQRFQLAVYPDVPRTWTHVDRWPDSKARDVAAAVYRRLDGLSADSVGAHVDDDGGIPYLRFADDAQPFFDDWLTSLMTRVRAREEHAAIEAHLGKYPALLAKLAVVFHLVDEGAGPVSLVAAQRAAAWCDLLEAHARRVYHTVAAEDMAAAHALLGRLRAGKLTSPFSARDVYRPGWAGLADRDVVKEALLILEDHGWVRSRTLPETGGRYATVYDVHPALAPKETP